MEDKKKSDKLLSLMRENWNERVSHDYRYWMSDGVSSDQQMWETGRRDFLLLVDGIPKESLTEYQMLDFGCGVGRITRAASDYCENIVGVDVSSEAIEKASQLLSDVANAKLILGEGNNLSQINNSTIDLIISFAVVGSIPSRVFVSYLYEFSRILKIGGKIRIQMYLGSEQDINEEDTLALRSYDNDRFIRALTFLGFKKDYKAEVKLPFEVSDYDSGCVAYVVGAEKIAEPSIEEAELLSVLVSNPEKRLGDSFKGSETACLVSLSRADQLIKEGDIEGAKVALEYSKKEYSGDSENVKWLMAEIQAAIKEVEEAKVPLVQLGRKIERDHAECHTQAISEIHTSEGIQVRFKNIVLSHATNPRTAAVEWAKRTLRSLEIDKPILFVGVGDNYFLEELRKLINQQIVLFEPTKDLLDYFNKGELKGIEILEDLISLDQYLSGSMVSNGVNLVVIPAAPLYLGSVVPEVRRKVKARTLANNLKPEIGIVGPLYGGTLPIAGYLYNACKSMSLRAEFIDLSSYYSGFTSFEKKFNKPFGRALLENQYVELMSELVYQIVDEKKLQIVISVALAPLSPKVLERLRAKGVVTIHWFMEDTRRFTTWKEIAKYYDYFFIIQKGAALEEVRNYGARSTEYLPLAFDPQVHQPRILTHKDREEYASKISFVGAGYNNRRHIFSKLSDLDIKIWGTEWPDMIPFKGMVQREGARVTVDEYTKIFSGTDININLHSSHERDGIDPTGDFVNPRTFELAGCEAFQLSDKRSLLPELFVEGEEIITFDSIEQLREQIAFYSKNKELREAVIKAAKKRVLKEHTYTHRLQTILEYVMADFGDVLQNNIKNSPWPRTLEAAKSRPELIPLLERKQGEGKDPTLEVLIEDSIKGSGSLSETEMKLLFLHHMRGQITQIEKLRGGGNG